MPRERDSSGAAPAPHHEAHSLPHPEEPAQRASRRMSTDEGDSFCSVRALAAPGHFVPGALPPASDRAARDATVCAAAEWREMWPLPCVSTSTTPPPAGTCRTSPSLVSYSTAPSSRTVSTRSGTLVPGHLAHALGDAGEAEVLCRIMRRQLERRRVGEDRPLRHGYVDLAEMRVAVRRGVDAQALHRRAPTLTVFRGRSVPTLRSPGLDRIRSRLA